MSRTSRYAPQHELEALRAELRRLMGSMAYAFAMGHGCSIGSHPMFDAVLEQERALRARIAEHEA